MNILRRLRWAACQAGFHWAHLTRGLLGYDYKCRDCGLVRYRDVIPPQWARFTPGRALWVTWDAMRDSYPLMDEAPS